MELGNNERRMLRAMLGAPARSWLLSDLLEATGWSDQVHVAGAGTTLAEAGLVEISERPSRSSNLGLDAECGGGGPHDAGLVRRRLRAP